MSKIKQEEVHGHDLRVTPDSYNYNANDAASKCNPTLTQGRNDRGQQNKTHIS
jgi:hypothetical protein